jgi:serine/threonine protein kinase
MMGDQSEFTKTRVGTPYYMCPELVGDKLYNEKVDIWSAGCIIYEMASLKPPFQSTNIIDLSKKIDQGKFKRIPNKFSEELQNLISKLI